MRGKSHNKTLWCLSERTAIVLFSSVLKKKMFSGYNGEKVGLGLGGGGTQKSTLGVFVKKARTAWSSGVWLRVALLV